MLAVVINSGRGLQLIVCVPRLTYNDLTPIDQRDIKSHVSTFWFKAYYDELLSRGS